MTANPNTGAVTNDLIVALHARPEVAPPLARWRRWRLVTVDEKGMPLGTVQARPVGHCQARMNAEPLRPATFVKKAQTTPEAFKALCANPAQLAHMNEEDVATAATNYARSVKHVEGQLRLTQEALDLLLAARAGFVPRPDGTGFRLSELGTYQRSFDTEPVEEEAA